MVSGLGGLVIGFLARYFIISTTQQINRREVRYLLRESNWMVNLLGIAFMMGALAQKIQEANSLQFMVGTIIGYLSIIVDFEDEP